MRFVLAALFGFSGLVGSFIAALLFFTEVSGAQNVRILTIAAALALVSFGFLMAGIHQSTRVR